MKTAKPAGVQQQLMATSADMLKGHGKMIVGLALNGTERAEKLVSDGKMVSAEGIEPSTY